MVPILPNTGILSSCFRIRFMENIGTCFTLFVNNKSYFVTAKHIVNGISQGENYALYIDERWNYFHADDFGFCSSGGDVAVIRAPSALDAFQEWGLREDQASPELFFGQSVVYLGFPLGLQTPLSYSLPNCEALLGLPTPKRIIFSSPFMKTGHLCGSTVKNGLREFYFDSLNNKGFSGGPILVNRSAEIMPPKISVVAVAVRYHYDSPTPIVSYNEIGELIKSPDYFVLGNSGYMVGVPITSALDVARQLSS